MLEGIVFCGKVNVHITIIYDSSKPFEENSQLISEIEKYCPVWVGCQNFQKKYIYEY